MIEKEGASLKYVFEGSYETNYTGIIRIIDFYKDLAVYENREVTICFCHLNWMDANLCAMLLGYIEKLKKENLIQFYFYYDNVPSKLNVLQRNGFLKIDGFKLEDDRQSVIQLKSFNINELDQFEQYIKNDLFEHRAVDRMLKSVKERMQISLIEVFQNFGDHADSNLPFFICGQFYPSEKVVRLTMVDMGVGFLKKIQEFTKRSSHPITTCAEAVDWAVKDLRSVKYNNKDLEEAGGAGLYDINDYFSNNKGRFSIVTGDAYWDSHDVKNGLNTAQKLPSPFQGSMINLEFSTIPPTFKHIF